MVRRRKLSIGIGIAILVICVFVIPYIGSYLAASNASHAYSRSSQNGAQLSDVQRNQQALQKLVNGMNSLLGFVASSQTRSGRANSIYFATQMQNICKATPGCQLEPLPPGLQP